MSPGPWARGRRHTLGVPLVALGIVAVSILSGVATWRASEWSTRADRFERLATQDLAFSHQVRAEIRAHVDQDLRTFGSYEQQHDGAVRLEHDAPSVLLRDPSLAHRMTRQAQHQRALANGELSRMGTITSYDDRGLVSIDPAAAIRASEAQNPDLANLRVSRNASLATTARDKATNLVGVAVILAASLLFLTLAQLTTQATSRSFAVTGTLVAGAAGVVFALV
jgi:hypothetical protein